MKQLHILICLCVSFMCTHNLFSIVSLYNNTNHAVYVEFYLEKSLHSVSVGSNKTIHLARNQALLQDRKLPDGTVLPAISYSIQGMATSWHNVYKEDMPSNIQGIVVQEKTFTKDELRTLLQDPKVRQQYGRKVKDFLSEWIHEYIYENILETSWLDLVAYLKQGERITIHPNCFVTFQQISQGDTQQSGWFAWIADALIRRFAGVPETGVAVGEEYMQENSEDDQYNICQEHKHIFDSAQDITESSPSYAVYVKNNTESYIVVRYKLTSGTNGENTEGAVYEAPIMPGEIALIFDDVRLLPYMTYEVQGYQQFYAIDTTTIESNTLRSRVTDADKLVTVYMNVDEQRETERGEWTQSFTNWLPYWASGEPSYTVSYDYEIVAYSANILQQSGKLIEFIFGTSARDCQCIE